MGFDDNYLFPALVTIFSARQTFAGPINLIVAREANSLSASSTDLLVRVCEALDVSVRLETLHLPVGAISSGHISKITWARVALLTTLKSGFVWLDADLILRPGWDALLITDLDGFALGGVLDNSAPSLESSGMEANFAKVAAGTKYVNAGVLVAEPSRIGSSHSERLNEAVSNYSSKGFQWLDQDAINYAFEGRVKLLPSEFNKQVSPRSLFKIEAKILHMTSDMKPWLGPFRLAFFWAKSVRDFNKVQKELERRFQNSAETLRAIRAVRARALRAEKLDWSREPIPKRFLLQLSRRIWKGLD